MVNPHPPASYLRCGTPDCEWGTLFPGFDKFSACQDRFRKHCIEQHGLDFADTERVCWFDLEARTLTLLEK